MGIRDFAGAVTISAGGVVVSSKGRVLVVRQKNGSWSLPKGHVMDGETLIAAARREIQEESGISSLDYIQSLGSYKRFQHGLPPEEAKELKIIHMFLFHTQELPLQPTDPENPEARWVSKDDVGTILSYREDKAFFESVAGVVS